MLWYNMGHAIHAKKHVYSSCFLGFLWFGFYWFSQYPHCCMGFHVLVPAKRSWRINCLALKLWNLPDWFQRVLNMIYKEPLAVFTCHWPQTGAWCEERIKINRSHESINSSWPSNISSLPHGAIQEIKGFARHIFITKEILTGFSA